MSPPKKINVRIGLTNRQYKFLQEEATRLEIPLQEIIRKILDAHLDEVKTNPVAPFPFPIIPTPQFIPVYPQLEEPWKLDPYKTVSYGIGEEPWQIRGNTLEYVTTDQINTIINHPITDTDIILALDTATPTSN